MTGRKARPAARILVIDPAGRVLLFRFDPADRLPFWCLPGGALDPGESYRDAARRELREETGIDADPGVEVARRVADFITLEGVPVTADERYPVRTGDDDTPSPVIDTGGHTALERRVIRGWRWFAPADLITLTEPWYPADLAELVRSLV